ncbi:MAG: alpha-(1-_3)-arabinofuranosyltransferase family protein, partial [Candidatus Baltobacteraceae bacterium]
LRSAAVPTLFVALALLVTAGFGSGVQLNDGQAALHIDPLKFLGHLVHAWNPLLYYGTHTGFWFPYETPYAWAYGLAQMVHVRQDLAQRVVVFSVYLACLWSMYYCLRSVAPWLNEGARIAGACAYLFNMYVALNSQAQIVWLLTYATLPAMVGVTARAMRGEMNVWRAALAVALLVLIGGGINPPLLAINVIVLALFVALTIAFDPRPAAAFRRSFPFLAAASVAAVLINVYWLVPFVDYFHGVWLNGVLSEAPSMHNAATSFENVLRGLGHWATFVSFAGRPYYPWAAAYQAGLFSALLWFVPIVALSGIAFKKNQRPATLFFLIVTIISVPLVVGYYHDALGDAVTTPIYDAFYRNFPGFQMFRFSYKWVAGVEFGISALYALAAWAIVTSLPEQLAKLTAAQRERWAWLVPAASAIFVLVPILVFVPVVVHKMNYPGQVIPSWEYRANALVGKDAGHRVALFPTQFLEQFDWGNPEFYIEDSLIDRPMVYGLLGSEPSEGTDRWVRRAYRATREGLPFAADMLRVLGVDTILQRDDFIPAIDFSSPGEWRFNTTTLTHDILHRVVGATPVRSDGPLHVYHIGKALPLVYGVTNPAVNTLPTFSDAYLGNVEAMAKGEAEFDPPDRSASEFSTSLPALAPLLPQSAPQLRDLAVKEALVHDGVLVRPPSADVSWITPFEVRNDGVYEIFGLEDSLLFPKAPPQSLQVDGRYFSPQTTGGAWSEYGTIELTKGGHSLSDGYPDTNLAVALVNVEAFKSWQDRIAALNREMPQNLSASIQVYGPKATVTIPRTGHYRITATAVGPFGPDGLVRAHVLGPAQHEAFPALLGATLPYAFGSGVVGTSAIMLPPQWYRADPTAYTWQRGDPASWFLFAGDSHVRVFVPGSNDVRARVFMRVSRLQVADTVTVRVDGRKQQTGVLSGPPADAQAYDSIAQLDGPVPVPIALQLKLHPGWNDVAFAFHPLRGERPDFGSEVISAAVGPDLSFTRIASSGADAARARKDPSFSAVRLSTPPSGLLGDPNVEGTVTGSGAGGVWLAAAVSDGRHLEYRLFPIAHDGTFDINLMHALSNGWNDQSRHIAGLWFLSRRGRPAFSNLYYNVHAMPGRALLRPASLGNLPLQVDGRAVPSQPILLVAGHHQVRSGDPEVKIGLLTIDPARAPRPKPFTLGWKRRSPTALSVAVTHAANPFLLVFGEAYSPEWQATMDGVPLKHVIVNGLSNGWVVPALTDGPSQIDLTFVSQRSYAIAAAVSIVSLIVIVLLACFPKLWPIRTSSP